ncbi:TlpA disulfide reductase family protein [Streptomyces sp. UH6]|uniref:TlpA family protein disulfide reductase n=1 Tax=Streptomyces sp. UH6 TaxID=2748379 RepID=UPI0015D518ED|nr:TlpA disulfide reductase family protein [Streptomyces sp. UH6]NYV76735.1 TlpA family protein disulfide reductase [Streptomyces sp. UH6]
MNSVRITRAVLAITTAVAGCLSLGACASGTDGTGAGAARGSTAAGVTTVPEDERRPLGGIRGETLDGQQLDVADHRGEVVVLNVWASWCSPCRAEAPHLVDTAEETRSEGVRFLGIATRDTRSLALAFEEKYGVTYPSLYDPTGRLILSGFPKGTLHPQAVPSTVVVDRKGRIAARALGALSRKDLREMIDPLLAEGPRA